MCESVDYNCEAFPLHILQWIDKFVLRLQLNIWKLLRHQNNQNVFVYSIFEDLFDWKSVAKKLTIRYISWKVCFESKKFWRKTRNIRTEGILWFIAFVKRYNYLSFNWRQQNNCRICQNVKTSDKCFEINKKMLNTFWDNFWFCFD